LPIEGGPFEEGNGCEVQYWIARELEKSGIARFREEERRDVAKLYKNPMEGTRPKSRANIQTARQFLSKTPQIPRRIKRRNNQKSWENAEYEKVKHLTRDIINSTLKKIVSLASCVLQLGYTNGRRHRKDATARIL